MVDCEYTKYGCKLKPANTDHATAHAEHCASAHLRLVLSALEAEVEKNRTMKDRMDVLEKTLSEQANNFRVLEKKVFELGSRPAQPAAAQQAQAPQQLQPAPQAQSASLSPSKPEPSKSGGSGSGVKDAVNRLSSSSPIVRPVSAEEPATPSPSELKAKERARFLSSGGGVKSGSGIKTPGAVVKPTDGSGIKVFGSKSAASALEADKPLAQSDSSVPARPHNSSSNISFPEQAKAHTMSTSKPEPLEEKSISSRLNRTKSSTLAKGFVPEAGWEVATIWEYDAVTESWARGITKLRLTSMPFAEGSLRNAHVCEIPDPVEETNEPVSEGVKDKNIKAGAVPVGLTKWTTGGFKYVIKISKTKVPIERYFEDVKMQIVCEELGKKFNNMGTPKKIDFLPAWVVELPRSPTMFCGLEPYIEGDFIKHANNHGMVLTDRNTPQAFSHFSWENTQHSLLVVDLQGVKDYYTDPQIHTRDGKGHGLGNLGMGGVDRFLKTHKCNAICQMLNLPAINQIDSSNSRRKVVKGTMMTPYIEDQLAHIPLVKMDIPDVLAKGEFTCVQTLSGHEDRVISIAISPRHLLSASSDGVVKAWNLPNFNLATTINAHRKSIECLAVSEKYFVTGSSDHCCKVWDFDNFNMVATLRDHLGDVNAVVLTDKTLGFLISASFDKTIKLWNMRTWKCVHTFEGHSKSVKTLALSGSILFSGSNDGSIMVWNLKYMSNIFTLQAHDGWVKTLQVRDKSLFSGGYDYLVKEWDLQSFNNISTFQEHNDNISSLLLTDRYLISGSDDKTIMVWDLATKKLVSTIKGHRLGVQALTTDGKHIISGSDDYSVKVWKWND